MTGIIVSIGPPTEGGRLYPRYDAESDILAVTTETPRDWRYGVDIDGNIVFDLDAKRRLANLDIHIGRRGWVRGTVPRWPEAPVGTIVFSEETIDQKSFNMPLRLVFDEEQGILQVALGDLQPDRQLELSKECVALLLQDKLVAFLLRGF